MSFIVIITTINNVFKIQSCHILNKFSYVEIPWCQHFWYAMRNLIFGLEPFQKTVIGWMRVSRTVFSRVKFWLYGDQISMIFCFCWILVIHRWNLGHDLFEFQIFLSFSKSSVRGFSIIYSIIYISVAVHLWLFLGHDSSLNDPTAWKRLRDQFFAIIRYLLIAWFSRRRS